eukprot:4540435-Pleurochrysis_carterae.AAC.1
MEAPDSSSPTRIRPGGHSQARPQGDTMSSASAARVDCQKSGHLLNIFPCRLQNPFRSSKV